MTVTIGDAIDTFFNALIIGFALFIITEQYLNRKYERIAREMFRDGKLNAGNVWQHYKNENFYTIQTVTNFYASGSDWPLTIVYMSSNGHYIYSRPAREFIRKFKLIDNDANEKPTPLDRLIALAFYAANKIDFPEVGSKWYHEYAVPTGHVNALMHMQYKNEVEFAIIESVTNKNQPTPYVNYRDEKGDLHTITLHHFRANFLLQKDEEEIPPVETLLLSIRNKALFEGEEVFEGSILTVNQVTDTKVVLEIFNTKFNLELDSSKGFYVGENYVYHGTYLQRVSVNQRKGNYE